MSAKVKLETVVDPEKKDPKAPSRGVRTTKASLNQSERMVPNKLAGAESPERMSNCTNDKAPNKATAGLRKRPMTVRAISCGDVAKFWR